ncbi:MAG TPA: 2'-5' RNA ligase family protein [Mycobacteriales bacterium]|nr:2'-5' RNA ligase family protein [Mycobacteriales bacterium]
MSPHRTIGVAIDLPEPHYTALRTLRWASGDPLAGPVPPHITLLPPTRVAGADLDRVEEHLAGVAAQHQPFEVHLSGPGTFRPVSQVVFVQVAAGLAQCEQLEAEVRSGPLHVTTRFPYHPHVTVAHDVADSALDAAYDSLRGYDGRFTVRELTMFEQDDSGVWHAREEFELGRRSDGRHQGAAEG